MVKKIWDSLAIAGIGLALGYLIALGLSTLTTEIWKIVLGIGIPAAGVYFLAKNPAENKFLASFQSGLNNIITNAGYAFLLIFFMAIGFTLGKITDKHKWLEPKTTLIDTCTWSQTGIGDKIIAQLKLAKSYRLDSSSRTIDRKIALIISGLSDSAVNRKMRERLNPTSPPDPFANIKSQVNFYKDYGIDSEMVVRSYFYQQYAKDQAYNPANFWMWKEDAEFEEKFSNKRLDGLTK